MPLIHIDRNMIEKCWQFSTDSAGTQQAVEYGQKNSRPRDVAEIARDNILKVVQNRHDTQVKMTF